MRYLVVTNDYEIFGNGTGDVRQHMVDPTERMARICENAGAPLTVFFEAEEYLAFERYRDTLRAEFGYDPAKLIRDQAIDLARRGHDVQLHLHPEWYGATYEGGAWNINPSRQTVDSLFNSASEAVAYIAERKAAVEEILAEGGSRRKVRVYRAGAFSAQPGERLLHALQANDFVIDSSVVKGLTRRNGFDYRNAPCAKGPWRVSSDVAREDKNGPLWEVPIYSEMGRRWQQLTFGRLRAKFSRNVPKGRRDQMIDQLGIKRTPLGVAKFLFQPIPIKLDFHNVSPAKLIRMIRNAPKPDNGSPDVLVLIGHSKEHLTDAPLANFLSLVARDPELKVVGFDDIAEMMRPKAAALAAN